MNGLHIERPPNGIPPLHPRPPSEFTEPSTSKAVRLSIHSCITYTGTSSACASTAGAGDPLHAKRCCSRGSVTDSHEA